MMVYQGDNWPAEYRGKFFMNNIHGARINMDIPERAGSGFVGHHGADFINFNDKWSQIINLQSGPDGAVYLIDWYDKNECHHNDVNGHDRSNGRIFKVSYGEPKFAKVDLQKSSDQDLIHWQLTGTIGQSSRPPDSTGRAQKDSTLGTKVADMPSEFPSYDPDKKLRWL